MRTQPDSSQGSFPPSRLVVCTANHNQSDSPHPERCAPSPSSHWEWLPWCTEMQYKAECWANSPVKIKALTGKIPIHKTQQISPCHTLRCHLQSPKSLYSFYSLFEFKYTYKSWFPHKKQPPILGSYYNLGRFPSWSFIPRNDLPASNRR